MSGERLEVLVEATAATFVLKVVSPLGSTGGARCFHIWFHMVTYRLVIIFSWNCLVVLALEIPFF